jgi:hypothetical protein
MVGVEVQAMSMTRSFVFFALVPQKLVFEVCRSIIDSCVIMEGSLRWAPWRGARKEAKTLIGRRRNTPCLVLVGV